MAGIVDLGGVHHDVEVVLAQGVCGRAGAHYQAGNTSLIQRLWREGGFEGEHGPLVHCAHDGAGPMRAAFVLRRDADPPASPLHPRVAAVSELLQDMPGFDLRIDHYGTTDLFDLRHILKRIMTDWVVNGVQVASEFISTSVLRTVVAAGMGRPRFSSAVNVLFEPFDKMRVPAALRFLDALAAFSPARDNTGALTTLDRQAGGAEWAGNPRVRAAIALVGQWASLATAMVDNLSVQEALTRVAAFAHLTLVLQLASPRKPGSSSRFVTPELNYDIQTSAAATSHHFATCVAVSKECGQPLLMLGHMEGSDKLEELYATIRRIRPTFSMEQMREVLQSAADSCAIIARHPSWRRRDIRRDLADTKTGARSDDHFGRADYDSAIVEVTESHGWKLPASWNAGKLLAENACTAAMQLKAVIGDEAKSMRVKAGTMVPTGVSFMTAVAAKRANMFFYVFKQLGIKGTAHEKKTLVCPIVAGQPLGVKAAAAAAAAAAAGAAAADGVVGVGLGKGEGEGEGAGK